MNYTQPMLRILWIIGLGTCLRPLCLHRNNDRVRHCVDYPQASEPTGLLVLASNGYIAWITLGYLRFKARGCGAVSYLQTTPPPGVSPDASCGQRKENAASLS
jgi:hypothetical protein